MKTIFWVHLMWIREELDTEALPNWFQEVDNMIYFYKKKHLGLFLSEVNFENINFEEFESLLKEELNTIHMQNLSFLNKEFSKDDEESKRLIMIINKVQLYWEERINDTILELKNPKKQVWFIKSLIAKILN